MRAEHAVAIRAFDYLAAVCFGAGAAVASWYLVPDVLPAPFAMVLGMVVGMASAFPLLGLFSVLLGGFSIIVMSMQIGMFAGMIGAMAMGTTVEVLGLGVMVGFVIQCVLHVADRVLQGEVPTHD